MSYRKRPEVEETVDEDEYADERDKRDKRLKSRKKDSYDEAERRRDGKWWDE